MDLFSAYEKRKLFENCVVRYIKSNMDEIGHPEIRAIFEQKLQELQ